MTAILTKDSLRDQTVNETHTRPVAQGTTPAPIIFDPNPKRESSGRAQTPEPINVHPASIFDSSAQDHTPDSGHSSYEIPTCLAAVGPDSPQATDTPKPKLGSPVGPDSPADHGDNDAQSSAVGGGPDSGQPDIHPAMPREHPLADPTLSLAADIVDDLERVRIAEENRLRSLTDADGFGLDEAHPDVARLAAIVTALGKVEHDAILNLNRVMRRHPLGAWGRAQKGIGEKTLARLLATMGGDPYVNLATGEARTVSQLWSYCGHGDTKRRPAKGMTQADLFACGNPIAKKRLWLIASKCLMAQGDYAQVYYARKAATEGREHAGECRRCGPSGKPALPGSPWSDAHRHADALRIVGKEILRDLWLESQRIHEGRAS